MWLICEKDCFDYSIENIAYGSKDGSRKVYDEATAIIQVRDTCGKGGDGEKYKTCC